MCSADFDAEMNPFKRMAVAVSGDHEAVLVTWLGQLKPLELLD